MAISIAQSSQTEFTAAMPRTEMAMVASKHKRETRPDIRPCPLCGGFPILEVTSYDGLLYLIDCPLCGDAGCYDKREHWRPVQLPRLVMILVVLLSTMGIFNG